MDLNEREPRELIQRIYWARFAWMVEAKGLDPDDCLQEVYRGFLTRNRGRRPFDPRMTKLSTYGYIVIRSVTFNFLDHHKRADRRLGVVGAADDASTWAVLDVAQEDDQGSVWSVLETGEAAPASWAGAR